MKNELEMALAACARDLFDTEVAVELTRPEEQFGDYATNIALQLAQRLTKPPREVAEQIAAKLRTDLQDKLQAVQVAGPGFINLSLSDQALQALALTAPSRVLEGRTVVAEYSDPNPFKVLHAGHLYTSVVGDAIANLLELAGGKVHRVNFGGDVGLHVAKTLWALLAAANDWQVDVDNIDDAADKGWAAVQSYASKKLATRAAWLASFYMQGTEAYDEDANGAKAVVVALNKRVYLIHEQNDHESPLSQIYWNCREWSYAYFDDFYARIGSHFEKYYPESETAPLGLKTVREQLANGVYEESDGAVVFAGEKYGLHTRVFINSHGLPTYEAKDVGLVMAKWRDYHFDRSVVITGNDIVEYMKVVLKSIEQFAPELSQRSLHLTHGNVKLAGGVKMSSRKGNILRATDVLDIAAQANRELSGNDNETTVLGAVKYSFLKQRMGGDIIYDAEESVTLEGNSGPYLQYAHARARSILRKAEVAQAPVSATDSPLQPDERSLLRKISEYGEVIDKAVNELMPHHVCTYLYELAQAFNRFYEHNRVIGDERQGVRLQLVEQYAETLQNGLTLLGIVAPDSM